MAIKGRKFSKQHLANLRAAHAKRRGKKLMRIQPVIDYEPVTFAVTNGLIDRMTQAIDKIKEQIERLETL